MKSALIPVVLMFSMSAFAADPQMKSDREAVNNSCAQEAKEANCGDQKVGSGLMKCIWKYKKEHKEFKVSDACKGSVKTLKADRQAKLEKKANEEAKK